MKTQAEYLGKLRIGVVRVPRECRGRKITSLAEGLVKLLLRIRIRCEPGLLREVLIVREEFGLQNVQAFELAEQPGRCIRNRTHWILSVEPFPLLKGLMRGIKIEVVHLVVAAVK